MHSEGDGQLKCVQGAKLTAQPMLTDEVPGQLIMGVEDPDGWMWQVT